MIPSLSFFFLAILCFRFEFSKVLVCLILCPPSFPYCIDTTFEDSGIHLHADYIRRAL